MSRAVSIGRRPELCCISGERFTPDEPVVAALVEGQPGEDPVRADTKRAIWARGERPEGTILGWWRTHARVSEQPDDAVDPSDLVEFVLSDDTEEAADPEASETRAAVRYLLALELVRRRKLVLEPSGDEQGDVVVHEPQTAADRNAGKPEPEQVTVPAPTVSAERLGAIAIMLGSLVGLDA